MTDIVLAGSGIDLRFAQVTNAGGRQFNQDMLGSARQDDLACFVVSDGAGGHAGGEVASNVVVSAMIDKFLQELSFGPHALRSCIDYAITRIAQRKREEDRLANMSATVAAVLIDQKNRCARWAHLGDTRIYLFRQRRMHKVTKDHSMVQQFIDAGYCKPEQLRMHPQRSVLFAAIGIEGDVLPVVAMDMLEIKNDDVFLICTDGFWEWITEDEMEQTLALATTVEDWLNTMSNIVEKNGSAASQSCDNYTAFAVWLSDPILITR